MSDGSTAFLLHAYTQSYDWGKLGSTSKAAQYAQTANPAFDLDENKPYAELWMGTHPNLPSKLEDGTLLSTIIAENPRLLGSKEFRDVPFLFKVLAIRKALSIQSHPDKALAERLHREQPTVYKDDNHKPELAIALTPFKALCGFLPLRQIIQYLQDVPELAALIPSEIVSAFISLPTTNPANSPNVDERKADIAVQKSRLKELFGAVMTAPTDAVQEQTEKLVKRYQSGSDIRPSEKHLVPLLLDLQQQFPNDIGLFCIYLLNTLALSPGQSIFLAAGEPHAYISGDIVECMATSDNVLRAGLTPKPRDVENLVNSLTYVMGGDKFLVEPKPWGGGGRGEGVDREGRAQTMMYDPPIPEFSILHVTLDEGNTEHHRGIDGPSIAIVTKGKGAMVGGMDQGSIQLEEGNVLFIGAGEEVVWKARKKMEVYRAFCE